MTIAVSRPRRKSQRLFLTHGSSVIDPLLLALDSQAKSPQNELK